MTEKPSFLSALNLLHASFDFLKAASLEASVRSSGSPSVDGASGAQSSSSGLSLLNRFLIAEFGLGILQVVGGSNIVSAHESINEVARMGNRVCRFVLDEGGPPIGTGFLISPCHVLTAGHLFFKKDDDRLIDEKRASCLVAEFRTIYCGQGFMTGAVQTSRLDEVFPIIAPHRDSDVPSHCVKDLDVAIVKLAESRGNDQIGWSRPREFFKIPPPPSAPVIIPGLVVQVLQYIDRGDLRMSSGRVVKLSATRREFTHDASTLDSASGSPIVNDRCQLLGMHLGASDDDPGCNRAVTVRQIAKLLSTTKGVPGWNTPCARG